MQLHWYATPGGNFGDDLNQLLWPRLFPGIDQHDSQARFYGIGTILGGTHDSRGRKVVLGSGRGDGLVPRLGSNWDFRWVRGPNTARQLGLPPQRALGDGAWLWDGLFESADVPAPRAVGLIPHHATWESFDWSHVAAHAGLLAINPKQAPGGVLAQMRGCARILTESLHGAIFADALGIPWAPCVLSHRFNDFKWRDWLATIERRFEPHVVDRPLVHNLGAGKAVRNQLARWTGFRAATRRNELRAVRTASPADVARVAEGLAAFARRGAMFRCSEPQLVARHRLRMQDACALFARDYGLPFTP